MIFRARGSAVAVSMASPWASSRGDGSGSGWNAPAGYRTCSTPVTRGTARSADRVHRPAHAAHDLVHLVVARVVVRRQADAHAGTEVEQHVLGEQPRAHLLGVRHVQAHGAAATGVLARRADAEAELVREREQPARLPERLLAQRLAADLGRDREPGLRRAIGRDARRAVPEPALAL